MAKKNTQPTANQIAQAQMEEHMPPKDFAFANVSYESATRELTRDNPSASIALSLAEQAGLGATAKDVLKDTMATLTSQTGDFVARDAAFYAVEYLNNFIEGKLPDNNNVKLAIQLITNGAVVIAKPAMIMQQAFEEDKEKRTELRAQIADFSDAYGETIRNSILNPLGNPKNAVLAKLEERLELQAHEKDAEIATSLILGTAQAGSRKLHSDNIAKNVGSIKEAKIIEGMADDAKAKIENDATAILAKPRLQTYDLFVNNPFGDESTVFSDKKPFANQTFNAITGTIAAGAAVSTQTEKFIENGQQATSKLIAADLILYLSEQAKLGEIDGGVVHIEKLRKDLNLGKDAFGSNGGSIPLEQFIELIFHTHVHDQDGAKIPERFTEKLREASSQIVDSIMGKGAGIGGESSLNPLALIELVGSGKIVAHDGLHVANAEIVADEVASAMQKMPVTPQMDTYKYIDKLGNALGLKPDETVEALKENLRGMDSDTRDFVALLVPTAVLVQELGLNEGAVLDAKARGSEYAVDNIKQILTELATRPDKDMLEDGMSKAQIKLLHENYAHVQAGDDDKLLQSLRQRDEHGLGFAVLACKSYIQELAEGKKLVGLDVASAANVVQKFERGDKDAISDSGIDPKNAQIAECSTKAKQSQVGQGELVRTG